MKSFVSHSRCILPFSMYCGLSIYVEPTPYLFYMLVLFNVEIVEDTGCALHSAVPISFGVNSSGNC